MSAIEGCAHVCNFVSNSDTLQPHLHQDLCHTFKLVWVHPWEKKIAKSNERAVLENYYLATIKKEESVKILFLLFLALLYHEMRIYKISPISTQLVWEKRIINFIIKAMSYCFLC